MAMQNIDNVQLSPPKKRKVTHFSVDDKTNITNTFKAYQTEHPSKTKTELVELTSKAKGIGVASVYRILREYKVNNQVLQPPMRYHRRRSVLDNVTEDDKNGLRRLVHSFFIRNEPPCISKIRAAMEEHELPSLKQSSLQRLLKEINFRFKRRGRNSVLVERDEIVTWRRRYLRQIKAYKEANKKIYYIDETWINSGHTVSKLCRDLTPRQPFDTGLTGLKNPSGKGERLIALHIGSENGFVDGGLLLFESKKNWDYHEETATVFENWFENIIQSLEENAVIVFDNAFYHSRRAEIIPTNATKKVDIQNWLSERSIAYEDNMVKAELLCLVKSSNPVISYVVENTAKVNNRHILRLPPYHSDLNPIEIIWTQIKGEVVRENATLKLADVRGLLFEAVQSVTPQNWQNAIEHVAGVEQDMWQLDIIMEAQVESLTININVSSSSDNDDDSDYEST